jgi:hypothetical protein
MASKSKRLREIKPKDLEEYWLWRSVPAKSDGELRVRPVKVEKTTKGFSAGSLAATKVKCADGSQYWALIEGIHPDKPEFSKHNRELRLFVDGFGWFQLAQYFDSDEYRHKHGENVLCTLLGKTIEDVFPISFDLSDKSDSGSPCLVGTFEINPAWGLAREEIMNLLVMEL